jgi:hypothetical protein
MKLYNSHSYAFATTLTPHVALLLANIATMGCFKVSIVEALTSAQFIATTKKYLIHNVTFTNILNFYQSNNPCHKHVEITTPPENTSSYFFMYFIC